MGVFYKDAHQNMLGTVTLKGFYLMDRVSEIISSFSPDGDRRMSIQPKDFLSCLIFGFMGDSKEFTIESVRRLLICGGDLSHQLERCYQTIQRMTFFHP
jgi:hypothetical protein